jgi:hypothetical protein
MRCYNHVFALIYGDFSSIPLILGITLQNRKPILCILTFQGPFETQIYLGFFWRQYIYMRSNFRTRSMRGGHLGLDETRWRGP